MRGHSSLGALVADHTATGAHSRRSIPRAEGEATDFEPTPWKKPRPLKARHEAVGALSVGDSFEVKGKAGLVLGRGLFILRAMIARAFAPGVKAWDPVNARPETVPRAPKREPAVLVRRESDKAFLLLRPHTSVVIQ